MYEITASKKMLSGVLVGMDLPWKITTPTPDHHMAFLEKHADENHTFLDLTNNECYFHSVNMKKLS